MEQEMLYIGKELAKSAAEDEFKRRLRYGFPEFQRNNHNVASHRMMPNNTFPHGGKKDKKTKPKKKKPMKKKKKTNK